MAQSVYSDCWTDQDTCAIIANLYGITTKSMSRRNTVVETYDAPAVTTMIAAPMGEAR